MNKGDNQSNILIVDDSSSDVALLKRTLGRLKITAPISVSSSGQEALSLLKGLKPYNDRHLYPIPTVIFLDLRLPDIDGFHIMDWISKEPAFRRTLIIIHSGFATVEDMNQLYRAGANTFLRKTDDLQELENIIKSYPAHFGISIG